MDPTVKSYAINILMLIIGYTLAVLQRKGAESQPPEEAPRHPSEGGGSAVLTESVEVVNPEAIPAHHVLAIAAATYVMNVRVRVIRLRDESGMDIAWTSVGRSLHQASHQVRR
ncbi:MAG: hypothetical protein HQL66_08890 [Magnetococcales bacterium]|nr:hypothetical protein [Magnetococcales bacterium]